MINAWSRKYRKPIETVASLLITLLITAFCLSPLYWVLITSFKEMGAEYLIPIQLWPEEPTLQAYAAVIGQLDFLTPVRNSFVVALFTAALALVVSSLSAYAIARMRFKYKVESLLILQLGAMIPPVVTIAPTFVLLRELGLLRTLPAMIIPNVFYNVPLATWLLASYFVELPYELEDAAKVDGYKPLQIFRKVVLPLSAPGLFAAGVFAFIGTFGEFMLANVVTMGLPDVQTVPVAIQNFSFQFRQQYTWVSAGIILALIPVVALVIIFQRWVIRGLTAGAVKY
ncbi:MAG: carbohydrate ABC transporter permease [Chloroflexi bacterium]|nr:carbohydrate ABC transporter permease [Chloroflexota bacterium]